MENTEQNHIQINLHITEVATILGALGRTGSRRYYNGDLVGTWVLPTDVFNILIHLKEVLQDQNAMKPEIKEFIRDLYEGISVFEVNASYKELI